MRLTTVGALVLAVACRSSTSPSTGLIPPPQCASYACGFLPGAQMNVREFSGIPRITGDRVEFKENGDTVLTAVSGTSNSLRLIVPDTLDPNKRDTSDAGAYEVFTIPQDSIVCVNDSGSQITPVRWVLVLDSIVGPHTNVGAQFAVTLWVTDTSQAAMGYRGIPESAVFVSRGPVTPGDTSDIGVWQLMGEPPSTSHDYAFYYSGCLFTAR